MGINEYTYHDEKKADKKYVKKKKIKVKNEPRTELRTFKPLLDFQQEWNTIRPRKYRMKTFLN